MKQKYPLANIKVKPQPRVDFSGLDSLVASIREHGLLQPIVIGSDGTLFFGERRYRACKQIGLTEVDVVFSDDAPPDELAEKQLVENIERKALSWQEEALGILDVYRKKRRRGALEGWTWGQRQCASMFNMQLGTINYVLKVAERLEQELTLPEDQRRISSFTSACEAYRLGILAEEEDRLNAILAQRAKERAEQKVQDVQKATDSIIEEITSGPVKISSAEQMERIVDLRQRARGNYLDLTIEEAKELYLSGTQNPPDGFETYYAEKKSRLLDLLTVDLSSTIIHGDSIDFMLRSENAGRFDHIITDIPYGIDMDMLAQENLSMTDVDRVAGAHDVKENEELFARFFPAAFACTGEKAYLATCCDVMQWQRMYDLAIAAGWNVQRWPVLWRKVNQSCMNGAAQYNTTKDFEPVMLCRKPGSTLIKKSSTSVVDASNHEAVKLTGHPFAKPFELTKFLVDLVSTPEQTILEPFAGGGSMALQMLRMQRSVVMVEKELHHYNSLLENIKQQYYLKLNPKTQFK